MNTGDIKTAQNIIYEILNLGPHYLVSYFASCLMIDIGGIIRDEQMIAEGIRLLNADFAEIEKVDAVGAHYNIGNGYSSLFQLMAEKEANALYLGSETIKKAKRHFKTALERSVGNKSRLPEILTNFGNLYDSIGRTVDALECYEDALKLNPDHGMTLGNKGVALQYYASMISEHQQTFLLESYSLLTKALRLGVTYESIDHFERHRNAVKN